MAESNGEAQFYSGLGKLKILKKKMAKAPKLEN